jgi:hypothetical protein
LLSCEYAKWFLIIHSNKTQLWSHFMVFFFFWFSRCMITFLRNHLNFQYSLVLNKHQNDFCFCTKLWILENSLEDKENTLKDSWCSGFVSKYCAQSVIYMKQQQKWKHVMNTGKHLILLTRRLFWQRKSCCIMSQVTNKTETS